MEKWGKILLQSSIIKYILLKYQIYGNIQYYMQITIIQLRGSGRRDNFASQRKVSMSSSWQLLLLLVIVCGSSSSRNRMCILKFMVPSEPLGFVQGLSIVTQPQEIYTPIAIG